MLNENHSTLNACMNLLSLMHPHYASKTLRTNKVLNNHSFKTASTVVNWMKDNVSQFL